MKSKHQPRAATRPAILFLDADRAEWLRWDASGGPVYGQSAVHGEGTTDLLQAATRAFQDAGGLGRNCCLLLGAGLVHVKILTLPPVPNAELRAILARKAENLVDCAAGEALYNAMCVGEGAADAQGRGAEALDKDQATRWILASIQRTRFLELLNRLRSAGFRVGLVVSARLAALSHAIAGRKDRSGAHIVVVAESRAVAVSLVVGEGLLHQSVLQGDLESQPPLALALIQEVKGLDAFWKKQSRGGSVQSVVILGVKSDRGELLANSVRSALPGVEVDLALGTLPAEQGAREPLLAAGLGGGAMHLDLSIPLPARGLATALVLAGFGALMLSLVGVTWNRLDSDEERLGLETARLLDQSADLPRLAGENERECENLEALDRGLRRLRRVEREGWPLGLMLCDVASAFGRDAAVISISAGRDEDSVEMTLVGVTTPQPITAMKTIEGVAKNLEKSPWFAGVRAIPPSMPPDRRHLEPLIFELRAQGVDRP